MAEKLTIKAYQTFNEKRFTKKDLFKLGTSTVFVLNFLPGQAMPAHRHPDHELVFNCLQGSGELSLGDHTFTLHEQEVAYGSGDEMIAFKNTGDENVSIQVVMYRK